jgi:hypothetical protein
MAVPVVTLRVGGGGCTPVWLGEFGTANAAADLYSTTPGSQGQWFTDLENFVQSSFLGSDWASLANPDKIFTHLCSIEQAPVGVTCTGTLPAPH